MFGLSVPAISAALLAAGEAPVAFAKETRGKAGGRLRVGLHADPEGHARALDVPGDGRPAAGRHRRRVPQPQPPEPHARARAGRQLEAERQRQRVDVQAAPGRQVRQRQADDRRRRHRDVSPPAHGPDLAGRLRLQRRALRRRRQKVDDFTITFKLDTPVANFPYLTSSTTYQAIILPKDYVGPFEKTPQTTGAFNLVAYTPGVSARYERNPNWWGGAAPLDGVDVHARRRHGDHQRAARRSDRPDQGITYGGSRALFNNSNVQIFKARGATHREIPMNVHDGVLAGQARAPGDRAHARPPADHQEPLQQPRRPRQRLAVRARLPVDREGASAPQGHRQGQAAHRRRRPVQGLEDEVSSPTRRPSCPHLAQIVKQSAKAIGGNIERQDPHEHPVLLGHPDDDAVAQQPHDDHRLGPPRRAERAAQRGPHQQGHPEQEGRHLERGALQEQEVRLARQVVRRPPSRSPISGSTPSRSSCSCSTRRR